MIDTKMLLAAAEKLQPRLYACGFLFDGSYIGKEEGDCVALIQKKSPPLQEGYFNAIGGKIEEKETPLEAMIREFEEEAGLRIDSWEHFCTFRTESAIVYWFTTQLLRPMVLKSRTAELVSWHLIDRLDKSTLVPNARWLLEMALVGNMGHLGNMWPYEIFEPSEISE